MGVYTAYSMPKISRTNHHIYALNIDISEYNWRKNPGAGI